MAAPRLLENVRVIDLSQYIPGPFATRQLADLGADVIKVEPPQGDPMRRFMAAEDAQSSPVYRHLNRGKRILKLDLKSAAGGDRLAALLNGADLLFESYRPGVLDRLGFSRARLDRINPRLIHCALSGYGQTGPYAQRAGHDINYCALSSQLIVSGSEERPLIGYPPIADHAAALQASVLMLAALHARDKHTGSIYLDVSISESILSWQHLSIVGDASERAASILNGGAACYNVYRCADGGFISLGAIETAFWQNFCHALEQPDWIGRQFDAMPQWELIAEVANQIASQPRANWQDRLAAVDCCFEALFSPAEIETQPQFKARRALTAEGPAYPAWINAQAVEPAFDPVEITASDPLDWNPR